MTENQKPKKLAYVPITLMIAFEVDDDLTEEDTDALRQVAFEQLGKRPELESPALYDFDFTLVEFESLDE